jgi:hypothetical protein
MAVKIWSVVCGTPGFLNLPNSPSPDETRTYQTFVRYDPAQGLATECGIVASLAIKKGDSTLSIDPDT